MPLSFSPELFISRYIKSATNGRVISKRLRRLLTITVFPIWTGLLVWSGVMTYQGIKAYKDVQKIENSIRITNSYYKDTNHTELLELEKSYAEDNKDLIYYLPAFAFIGLIAPWIVIRILFWVIDAKETEDDKKSL